MEIQFVVSGAVVLAIVLQILHSVYAFAQLKAEVRALRTEMQQRVELAEAKANGEIARLVDAQARNAKRLEQIEAQCRATHAHHMRPIQEAG